MLQVRLKGLDSASELLLSNHETQSISHHELLKQLIQLISVQFSQHSLYVPGAIIFDVTDSIHSSFLLRLSQLTASFFKRTIPLASRNPFTDVSTSSSTTQPNIFGFFSFISTNAKMQTVELLHILALIRRLVEVEASLVENPTQRIANYRTLGTIMLCAAMITQKITRDVPIRNSWWSRAFNISLKDLNRSETLFMDRLDYHLLIEWEQP